MFYEDIKVVLFVSIQTFPLFWWPLIDILLQDKFSSSPSMINMEFRRLKEQLTHINLQGKKKNILLWCRRWIPRREWKCRTIWGSESSGRWPSPGDDRMELSAWNIQIVACYSIQDSMRRRKPFLKCKSSGQQMGHNYYNHNSQKGIDPYLRNFEKSQQIGHLNGGPRRRSSYHSRNDFIPHVRHRSV